MEFKAIEWKQETGTREHADLAFELEADVWVGTEKDCYAYFYPEESYERRPSFRPFTSEELSQLVGKVVKLKAGGFAGNRSLVNFIYSDIMQVAYCELFTCGDRNRFITAEKLLEYYVLDDGTPCGVEEE
jgi:hypothetical protein